MGAALTPGAAASHPASRRRHHAAGQSIQSGSEAIVDLVLKEKASVEKHLGHHPLESAIIKGYLALVKTLYRRGVNLNAAGKRNRSMLKAAVQTGNVELVRFLVKRGAVFRKGEAIPTVSADDETLLACWRILAEERVVKMIDLLKAVNTQTDKPRDMVNSELHALLAYVEDARGMEDLLPDLPVEAARLLLERYANPNANMRRPLLEQAARLGHVERVRLLLDFGTDPAKVKREHVKNE